MNKLITYIVTYQTNYDLGVAIINATSIEKAREIADKSEAIWDGYDIEELNTIIMHQKYAKKLCKLGKLITHRYFTEEEYVKHDEMGFVFEDGVRVPQSWWTDAEWKLTDWSVYSKPNK